MKCLEKECPQREKVDQWLPRLGEMRGNGEWVLTGAGLQWGMKYSETDCGDGCTILCAS